MARRSREQSRFAWSTMLYILLVLVAPMVLLGSTARAQEDGQAPMKENDTGVTGPVIGIDLGTTYSCVGIMKGGKVEILVNDQGNRITPSYVAWNDDERLVGDAAKNQFASNPLRTVYDIKRLIGRKFVDKDVQRDIKHFPFKVVNVNGQPRVQIETQSEQKTFTPEEISSMILGKMKEVAEAYLGEKV
ncbi:hypothetical protein LTR28_010252, partial [Elasticomyces elasticus]